MSYVLERVTKRPRPRGPRIGEQVFARKHPHSHDLSEERDIRRATRWHDVWGARAAARLANTSPGEGWVPREVSA